MRAARVENSLSRAGADFIITKAGTSEENSPIELILKRMPLNKLTLLFGTAINLQQMVIATKSY